MELSGDSGNKYDFPSPQPRARHTVQIRAADTRVLQWGAWSPPVEFGRYPPQPAGGPSWPDLTSGHVQEPEELPCGQDLCPLPPWPCIKGRNPTPFRPGEQTASFQPPRLQEIIHPGHVPPAPASVSGQRSAPHRNGACFLRQRRSWNSANHPDPWLPAANFYDFSRVQEFRPNPNVALRKFAASHRLEIFIHFCILQALLLREVILFLFLTQDAGLLQLPG